MFLYVIRVFFLCIRIVRSALVAYSINQMNKFHFCPLHIEPSTLNDAFHFCFQVQKKIADVLWHIASKYT